MPPVEISTKNFNEQAVKKTINNGECYQDGDKHHHVRVDCIKVTKDQDCKEAEKGQDCANFSITFNRNRPDQHKLTGTLMPGSKLEEKDIGLSVEVK